ncbi:MAG: hypothetical protein HY867_10025 [Chloroflexi bacterium]|nr:hypothetical protein [Chloroflexota bacterium]
MKKRRLWFLPLLLLVVPLILFGIYVNFILYDIVFNEPGADAPVTIGSFNVIENSTIDPATILSSIGHGDQNIFDFKPGLPDDWSSVTSVEWRQADYVNLATSIFQVAWNESISGWKLYRMDYFTGCDHPEGFSSGEFYFYLVTSDHKKYSARGIDMEPESAFVAWGGDTYYRRPFFGWKVINLKEMTVTAEEALRRAEARGGTEFRLSIENQCRIYVQLWPEVRGRYDWRVHYWDDDIYRNRPLEFWIPTK